jgi:hypothetical protein
MRKFAVMVLLLAAGPLYGQSEERGWRLNTRFQGSLNEAGQIFKIEPTVGYDLNQHFQIYAGLPVYFVKKSTMLLEGGLGNATLGFVGDFNNPLLHFNSTLVFTAPTGDRDRGFSTGHVTADWTNTFSRRFSTFVPFGSIGVANTVSDTAFFVRPFSSDGLVSHFEAGGIYGLNEVFSAGASYYGVRARGEQQFITRERIGPSGQPITQTRIVQADGNDNGGSVWLSAQTGGRLDYMAGYSRSSAYDLNSIFFGIGFRLK